MEVKWSLDFSDSENIRKNFIGQKIVEIRGNSNANDGRLLIVLENGSTIETDNEYPKVKFNSCK